MKYVGKLVEKFCPFCNMYHNNIVISWVKDTETYYVCLRTRKEFVVTKAQERIKAIQTVTTVIFVVWMAVLLGILIAKI